MNPRFTVILLLLANVGLAQTTPKTFRYVDLTEQQKALVERSNASGAYLAVSSQRAPALIEIRHKISQAAGGDLYLMDGNRFALIIPGDAQRYDDEFVYGFAVSGGAYDYTTVQGANRRIPKYIFISSPSRAIQELEADLSSGNGCVCLVPTKKQCFLCNGTGKSYEMQKRSAGAITCSSCAGTGSIETSRPNTSTKPSLGAVQSTVIRTRSQCQMCNGTGRRALYICDFCDGAGKYDAYNPIYLTK